MGLLEMFGMAKAEPSRPELYDVKCCGRSDFVVGQVTFGFAYNPVGGHYARQESGAIVACCHCGKRYGVNSDGRYMPHEDAMPGPWALQEMKRKQEATPMPKAAPARSSFRRPPRDE